MTIPLALIPLIAAGVGAASKAGMAAYQNRMANKVAKPRPAYTRPGEIQTAEELAANAYNSAGNTRTEQQVIDNNLANAAYQLSNSGNNSAANMAMIAALAANAGQAKTQAVLSARDRKDQLRGQYQQQLQNSAQYTDKEFQVNKLEPYQNAALAAQQLKSAAGKNMEGAIKDIVAGGLNAASSGLTSKLNPLTAKTVVDSLKKGKTDEAITAVQESGFTKEQAEKVVQEIVQKDMTQAEKKETQADYYPSVKPNPLQNEMQPMPEEMSAAIGKTGKQIDYSLVPAVFSNKLPRDAFQRNKFTPSEAGKPVEEEVPPVVRSQEESLASKKVNEMLQTILPDTPKEEMVKKLKQANKFLKESQSVEAKALINNLIQIIAPLTTQIGKTLPKTQEVNNKDYQFFKNSLPPNLKNTPEEEYAMKYYWDNYGKPKTFEESIKMENPMFFLSEDGYYHAPSVEPSTLRFLKPKGHPTIQKELDWYNSNEPEAIEFRNKYKLDKSGEYYRYIPRTNKK